MNDELDIVDTSLRTNFPVINTADVQETEQAAKNNGMEAACENNNSSNWPDPLMEDSVYMNYSAIAHKEDADEINRRPVPPTPTENDVPVRILDNGWSIYMAGERTFYYNQRMRLCQWKPPRKPKLYKNTSETASECEASTSVYCANEENVTSSDDQLQPTDEYVYMSPKNTSSKKSDLDNFPRHPNNSFEQAQINASTKTTLANSIDSGIGRSSISYKNHGFGLTVPQKESNTSASTDISDVMSSSVSSNPYKSHTNDTIMSRPHISPDTSLITPGSNNHFLTTAIRQGTLEKCKLADCGVKAKKKEWILAYAYLTTGHLLFYKDQKSAEKCGKHYPPPTDVCDLRGAIVSYLDKDKVKDKRRKYVLALTLINKTEFLFNSASEMEMNAWFHVLRQTISNLPYTQAYPHPGNKNEFSKLQRVPSNSSSRGSAGVPGSESPNFHKSHHLRFSTKLKKSSKGETDPPNPYNGDGHPTRESIIERLLRFFRSRPSVESLRERGIYRPEPVFGSTLAAICQHDQSKVPRFLIEVTRLIEDRGLDVDGLYRVSGNQSSVQRIRCQVDQDRYDALKNEEDVHVLTGAVKLFFRELSEPLFPTNMNKEFMTAIRQSSAKLKLNAIDDLLQKLPPENLDTLKVLVSHLHRMMVKSSWTL
uniref:Uncharacterized protein n=1 Tax=Acrobeloides nanus TaxID=290746 RepID=A0A914BZI1_9BILA